MVGATVVGERFKIYTYVSGKLNTARSSDIPLNPVGYNPTLMTNIFLLLS